MSDDAQIAQRIAVRLSKLREEEEYKRMLYDRTIGGPNAPRPSIEFIEQCVGPPKSDEMLQQEARETIEREQRQAMIDEMNREAVEQSMRDHNARMEEMRSLNAAMDRVSDDPQMREAFNHMSQDQRDDFIEEVADHEHERRMQEQDNQMELDEEQAQSEESNENADDNDNAPEM